MHAAAETDKGERQSQLLLLLLGAIDLQVAMSLSIKHNMKERVGGIHFIRAFFLHFEDLHVCIGI